MTTAAASSPSVGGALRLIASDIKLAHSIFALPFAVLGAFMAGPVPGERLFDSARAGEWRAFAGKLALVVVCMVLARTWAMLFNRLVDVRFDAENARTARRVFASGRLSTNTGWAVACGCTALFCGVTALYWLFYDNPWPLALSIPVLAWIAFYSLTKRFTMLCHVFLGGALAASPLAAAIAVEPSRVLTTPALWCIAGFVLAWVAGFDILYALQDEEFDRGRGLHSVPAKLGTSRALLASRVLHGTGLALLVLAQQSGTVLGALFAGGILLVGALLVLEHTIVAVRWRGGKGEASLNMAFFTVNGVVSCVLGVLGVVDVLT
ncbi:MAG: 4-hydroxybenzoate octaprenyltransferase [Phycisphaerales bacterium]